MAKRRRKGEGSIYQRPDGTWTTKITYTDNMGRTQRKQLYAKSEKDIRSKKKAWETAQERGVVVPEKMKVSTWLDTWLETYKKPSVKQTTYEGYERVVEKHLKPTIGQVTLKNLRPEHIQAMINEKSTKGNLRSGGPLEPRMVEYIYTVLHVALEQAYINRLITYNPADMVKKPRKERQEYTFWTAEHASAFLEALRGDRGFIVYLLALNTGLRRSELLALKWEDIDLKKGLLSVRKVMVRVKGGYIFQDPKTKKSKRTIQIPKKLISGLKEWKKIQVKEKLAFPGDYNELDLVICSDMGQPVNPEALTRNFAKDRVKVENLPKIRFHDLRHTHASILLERGVDLKTISDRLGHSTINMTADVYSHITEKLQAKAITKLDEVLKF